MQNALVESRKRARLVRNIKNNVTGWLFISPVVLGILLFTLWPMLSSLWYSFTKYDVLSAPEFIGFRNYTKLFTRDVDFHQSLWITCIYTIVTVPMNLVLSFLLAMVLNQKMKGIHVFRTIIYIPVIVPAVVSSLLWLEIYNVDYGVFNRLLHAVGLPESTWLTDSRTALPSLIMMSLWGLGGGMVIWIASLKGIPESMYESAQLEGVNWFQKTWYITIPMCSPVIFYNLVMSIIGTLQTFGSSFIMTGGGPEKSTLFIVLKIYQDAFAGLKMGYASSASWVLFLIIMILTLIVFKTSSWVYYGEDNG